jgi:hypothetical protein
VRPRIAHQASLRVEGVRQCGDVRETAQHFWVSGNEVVVDPGQQLVGIETLDNREHAVDARVSERRMQVGETVADRRRAELVDDLDIVAKAEREAESAQALLGQFAHLCTDDRQ